ncbi:chemotactic signal-response protein chel [Marinicauda salina]|uniref:Chemotactic signal-response protein chel n=1 Tax=Marinicauda salina TaxID=2135793 RepID=A0A2U2BUA1_9PROT|nr:rod-binding protein [Marinicauda salina]PWE17560.1 chemotactic signal-response protein chel [Marinicauda salina]
MDGLMNAQMQAALSQANGSSTGAPQVGRVENMAQAREVAQDFEAMFLAQLLEHMMGESTQSEAFGGGPGESAFKGMLNEEYAKVMAQAGGIGLADELAREIMTLQEAEDDA